MKYFVTWFDTKQFQNEIIEEEPIKWWTDTMGFKLGKQGMTHKALLWWKPIKEAASGEVSLKKRGRPKKVESAGL